MEVIPLGQVEWRGAKDLKVSARISLLPFPRRSPELNGRENIRQFM